MNDKKTVIIEYLRTSFCKAGTSFKDLEAQDLGALVIREMMQRLNPLGIDPSIIDVIIGSNVATPFNSPNVARVTAVKAGLPETIPAFTLGQNCGTGISAIRQADLEIQSQSADVVLVVATESMSNIPLIYSASAKKIFEKLARERGYLGQAKLFAKLMWQLGQITNKNYAPKIGLLEGLTDPLSGLIMTLTAEKLAKDPSFNITREDQDLFALRSFNRAEKAMNSGLFKKYEIAPLCVSNNGKHILIDSDNGIRLNQTIEQLRKLNPSADRRYGTVTAGNSSQVTDGAACMLLMSEKKAKDLGLSIRGYVGPYKHIGFDPSRMGLSPVGAIAKILKDTNRSLKDFDTIEINEAFAAQVIACTKTLESDKLMHKWFGHFGFDRSMGTIDPAKLNPNGGAIALGHPVGVSGVRLAITALGFLEENNGKRALISACIGGGQGNAMILERRMS